MTIRDKDDSWPAIKEALTWFGVVLTMCVGIMVLLWVAP